MKAALPLCSRVPAAPFAAVVAAVFLAWALLAVNVLENADDGRSPSPADTLPPVRAFPQRTAITQADRHDARPLTTRAASAEERLANSADLFDFVESIRRHSLPGGHYLALKAYDFCNREARQTLDMLGGGNEDSGAVADGRQLDAQARLVRLCGALGQRHLTTFNYHLLAEEGLQAQDSRLIVARRLERLSAQWDTASRDDRLSRQTLIADVLTGGDGSLIRDLAGEFEVILHTGQLLIGGQRVDASESADVIDALWIMACEHGASCTRDGEWQQLLACASAGECAPAPPIAGGNALRWRGRIREALLAGNTGIDVEPMAEQRY